ncbi:MAG TPA: tyrosine--tRNA ligase [Candidatus Cloacimonetes bacterium]|nr:tyrosine--tRNA ligase [Candidatus Cloacimonadota bacterium]
MEIIKQGVDEIIPEDELVEKLKKSEKEHTPLRIKYGIDPTAADVHIGHMVPIRIMRRFQDLGHTGVIVIGDYTAQIGDPTGKNESRPPLTADDVKRNAEKYMDQLYYVLDKDKTEVRYQSEWFGKMKLVEFISLLGKFTMAQIMAHETFRKRYEENLPFGLHELMYPILQAYDSVAIRADVELGATEQKFNILAGRDMQRYFNMPEQVAILMPILVGTDGIEKMSKSLGNYIAIFDSPEDKYGKVMSIPDELIENYFLYAAFASIDDILEMKRKLKEGVNPKEIKQELARRIVTLYHDEDSAKKAEEHFNTVFTQKDVPDNIPEFVVKPEKIWLVQLLNNAGLVQSNGEGRRMIKQGAVSINGERISDMDYEFIPEQDMVLKVGKRRFCKLVLSQ